LGGGEEGKKINKLKNYKLRKIAKLNAEILFSKGICFGPLEKGKTSWPRRQFLGILYGNWKIMSKRSRCAGGLRGEVSGEGVLSSREVDSSERVTSEEKGAETII